MGTVAVQLTTDDDVAKLNLLMIEKVAAPVGGTVDSYCRSNSRRPLMRHVHYNRDKSSRRISGSNESYGLS